MGCAVSCTVGCAVSCTVGCAVGGTVRMGSTVGVGCAVGCAVLLQRVPAPLITASAALSLCTPGCRGRAFHSLFGVAAAALTRQAVVLAQCFAKILQGPEKKKGHKDMKLIAKNVKHQGSEKALDRGKIKEKATIATSRP